MESNQPHATQKQINLTSGELPRIGVKTDRTAARQILDNLISNAVKYSPHGATVHVELVAQGGQAHIRVSDQGPGLSEEDQKNLFKKFCRLSAQPTGGESSNGLGLAIAHRLARALSGDIRCESTLGAGSTFILSLPLPEEVQLRAPLTGPLPRVFTPHSAPDEQISRPQNHLPRPAAPRHHVAAPPGPMLKRA